MPSPILPVTIKQSPKHSFLDPTPPISSPTSINPAMLLKQEIIDDPETRILISSPFDEETAISTKPLLSRSSSFVGTTTTAFTSADSYQQRRRRIVSDTSLPSLSDTGSPRQSVSREMGHAAVETFLLTRLSLKLLTYLGYIFLYYCVFDT